MFFLGAGGGGNDIQWCFSQVKGAVDDDVAEGKNKLYYSELIRLLMKRSKGVAEVSPSELGFIMHNCIKIGKQVETSRHPSISWDETYMWYKWVQFN